MPFSTNIPPGMKIESPEIKGLSIPSESLETFYAVKMEQPV
jgi:hypothetical protein